MKKYYMIDLATRCVVEIDDSVIDLAMTKEWQDKFYYFGTREDAVMHIAYNLIVNNPRLSMLDGWADMDDNLARVPTSPEWDIDYIGSV